MLRLFSFLFALLFFCAAAWSACVEVSYPDANGATCFGVCRGSGTSCNDPSYYSDSRFDYYFVEKLPYGCNCDNGGNSSITPRVCIYQKCPKGETPQSSSSSAGSSSSGDPGSPSPGDTTYQCQNSGGPDSSGLGSPRKALLYQCYNGVCYQRNALAGTCQDWDFCPDGVDDCEIPPEKGRPPCGRAGSGFTSSTRCYYACADGRNPSCKPVSTEYVAGAQYVGSCPEYPPDGCLPTSSSSGSDASSSSDNGGGGSGSSGSTSPPPDTISLPDNQQIDYTPILQAIHDTLHHANEQRDLANDLQIAANNSFDIISNYEQYNYEQNSKTAFNAEKINTALKGWQDNGFSLVSETADDISESHRLLDEINRYLKSDSLFARTENPLDTTYSPLLRDIKRSLDSLNSRNDASHDTSRFVRDTVFAKWFADYWSDSASSKGPVGKAIKAVTDNFSRDSSQQAFCKRVNACYLESNPMDCLHSLPGDWKTCIDGGTPFDGVANATVGILDAIKKAFWPSDALVDSSEVDTNVTFPASKDSAENNLSRAVREVLSPDSTQSLIQRVKRLKDSVEALKNDTTKIQPDSLYLDSAAAAKYISSQMINAPTSQDCFVCRADLGNFGGLSDTTLKIVINFGDFGGYNFCEIFRTVVRIITLVTCISLQLGSWAAAFGYNPKNDA